MTEGKEEQDHKSKSVEAVRSILENVYVEDTNRTISQIESAFNATRCLRYANA